MQTRPMLQPPASPLRPSPRAALSRDVRPARCGGRAAHPPSCGSRPGLSARGAAWLTIVAITATAARAAPEYARDVAPILRTYCSGCHNDKDKEAGFSVETYAALRAGGDGEGAAIASRDPAGSVLIRRITSKGADHMPPDDEPQVPAADLATLEAWIRAGGQGPASDVSILRTLVVPRLPAHVGPRPVTAIALSADGGRMAVARGREVEIRDVRRPGAAPLATIADLPGRVAAVHFSGDGSRLVVAGGIAGLSGVAEIRAVTDGSLVRSFADHRDMLLDAELSPDGNTLATAGYDRSIKLWHVAEGSLLRSIDVHNGAVFDLAWHPSGKLLASASADETVKLWRAADGVRLDTLNAPQGEVRGVVFTPDGGRVLAAGRDRRIHAWRLVSLDAPATNLPLLNRFAHEAPITALGITVDGSRLVTAAEDRSLRIWTLPDVELEHDFPSQTDIVAAVAATAAGGFVVGRMDGSLDPLAFPAVRSAPRPALPTASMSAPVAVSAGPAEPADAGAEHEPNDDAAAAATLPVPARVTGAIGRPGDADCFRFAARRGVPVVLEVNAARSGSKLDSLLEVLDAAGRPVEQVLLQATRDSWFTFRGKDSTQTGDFRVHNWEQMEIDEYLYASGEVTRLWRYPEGPDSGFDVYPGEGRRFGWFGTTPVTHAMGEPAWIVTPLPPGSRPVPNGLPVFPVHFRNDDDSTRLLGSDSQILFTPPADGDYVARVTDVRGFGAAGVPADFRYTLAIRPSRPDFSVEVVKKSPEVGVGSGRSITFAVTRREGFDGPVRIEAAGLPAGFTLHGPIEVEAGQRTAKGVLSAAADATDPDATADAAVAIRAVATIDGREVVHEVGTLGDIQLGKRPQVALEILPMSDAAGGSDTIRVRPGQTVRAKVRAIRADGFSGQIELGKARAGRNLPHGVFVDNIGLNGLLITEGQDEREFVIRAAPVAKPGRRPFHVAVEKVDAPASPPVWIEVLPP